MRKKAVGTRSPSGRRLNPDAVSWKLSDDVDVGGVAFEVVDDLAVVDGYVAVFSAHLRGAIRDARDFDVDAGLVAAGLVQDDQVGLALESADGPLKTRGQLEA